ncbi:hypothetical protein CY34DRAFT_18528 [Suillus luteus UH-Slu-Lm8-n1]|uniref:Uncharacterized protein n=1 Tax=Suillus luteus UH-Slu-Lm8-n1 TaxID=930992 RepID=A0A0C9Z6P3_9AGAM|nr:hypothetical protein CY34DRAFT_18528 [Suillus luteus UH-Slu-Lm8-n1]
MARKSDWDRALKSTSIQRSTLVDNLYLKGHRSLWKGYSNITHLLLLIKVIVLFNANQHDEAILRVQELAATFPNADTLACRNVEVHLRVQLGLRALDGACHTEAADHFIAAAKTIAYSFKWDPHSQCQDFTVLFGWDLESLWQIANHSPSRCYVFLRAGGVREAHKSYGYMMDHAILLIRISLAFKQQYSVPYAADGVADLVSKRDAALTTSDYDTPVGGITRLQSFCEAARLLTIVYLSDVPPSSKPGALARSAWNTQGRTFQGCLALQLAWSIINDTYRSDLCLRYPPHPLAITALYLAVVLHGPTRELLQQRSRSVEATPVHSSPRRSSRQSSSTSLSHGKKPSQDFVAFFAELNVSMPSVATIAQEIISLAAPAPTSTALSSSSTEVPMFAPQPTQSSGMYGVFDTPQHGLVTLVGVDDLPQMVWYATQVN